MILNIGKYLLGKQKIANSLLKKNCYQYYVYLKDHNAKINPKKSKLSLSYMDPKKLSDIAPVQRNFEFALKKKTQMEVEKKLFEQYKQKVLKGQIDQEQEVQLDPLWGEMEKPIHYYKTLNKVELMKSSYPQSSDIEQYLSQLYKAEFNSVKNTQLPDIKSLIGLEPSDLVQVAFLARNINNFDRNYWYQIEQAIGNRFYKLSTDSLINLHYALNGKIKMGTPKLNNIVNDLLIQDAPKMSKKQLINLFYTCRYLRRQFTPLLRQILKNLDKFYHTMTTQEKINWLLTYCIGRRPSTLVRTQKKIVHQQLHRGHEIIFKLQFPLNISQYLDDDLCIKLIYSLAKLRAKNTYFLTNQILNYIKKNFQSFSSNVKNVYKALFYLEEVNGGEGVFDEQLFKKLISVVTKKQNFQQLNKYQKIKTLYAIWNYKLMNEEIFQIYKNVEIESDSTILHYFCQIQLSRSSQREWQILRCIAELDNIPLPYFVSYKRFYNYMKESTDWDLQPIQQKLRNTQYYFNSQRCQDSFYSQTFYSNIMNFLKFTGTISPFQHTFPIDNVELAQFGSIPDQVSVDVIDETGFIPGTNNLKQTFVNKIRSLKQIGWQHVYLRQKQLMKLSIQDQYLQIVSAYQPYVQSQKKQIERRQLIRSREIQQISTTDYWDNMVAEQAQGLRNNPEQYLKKVAQHQERQRRLMQQIDKLG